MLFGYQPFCYFSLPESYFRFIDLSRSEFPEFHFRYDRRSANAKEVGVSTEEIEATDGVNASRVS